MFGGTFSDRQNLVQLTLSEYDKGHISTSANSKDINDTAVFVDEEVEVYTFPRKDIIY